MQSLKNRLLQIFCIASLVLGLLSASMWVRGYWRGDTLRLLDDCGVWTVEAHFNNGKVFLWASDMAEGAPFWWSYDARTEAVTANLDSEDCHNMDYAPIQVLGFGVQRFAEGSMHLRNIVVTIPFWALTLLFLAYPLWTIFSRRFWREDASRAGRCRQCDYDLRASSERCPECGTPIPSPKNASTPPA